MRVATPEIDGYPDHREQRHRPHRPPANGLGVRSKPPTAVMFTLNQDSVGPELGFDGSVGALGLEDSGEVGIAASAFSTNVNSSVTNWIMDCT